MESHQEEVQDLAAPSTCRRIGAALIDFALFPVLAFFGVVLVRWTVYADYEHPHYYMPPSVEGAVVWAMHALVPLGIEFPTTAYFGTSIGKCVFGIKVLGRRTDSRFKLRALFRTLFKWFYFLIGVALMCNAQNASRSRFLGHEGGERWLLLLPEGWEITFWDIAFSDSFFSRR